jgi:hypothetical protein
LDQNAQHDKITLEGGIFLWQQGRILLLKKSSLSYPKLRVHVPLKCRKYGISKTTIDYWRKKLLNPNDSNDDDEKVNLRKENIMLRSIIVDKDLEIAYLKELLKKTNRL